MKIMNAIIQVQDLHFGYNDLEIIQGIDLQLDTPKFIGIIGANGCGKTTLLKNISGYYTPWRGRILINNKNIQQLSGKERAQMIGFVPQNISDDFTFTCYDLVMMGRIPYLRRFQRERQMDREIVRRTMELTHTWDYRNRHSSGLSGGEQQRVYIARALAQQPRILLLDEPISHLDIKFQVETMNLLKELANSGILVLAVLHDINLASQFCDEIILMKEGAILSQGKSPEVLIGKNIHQAFAIHVEILENPFTHTPYIVPVSEEKTRLKVV